MLKDLFDRGKCLVGMHQGEWAFDAPARCAQTRACAVCAAKESRIEHAWSEWKPRSSKSCEQTRQCERCRDQEARVEHAWADWGYTSAGNCLQARVCSRCNAVADDTQVVHQWGPWAYDEAHRAPIRTCGRCSLRVSRFPRQTVTQDSVATDAASPPDSNPWLSTVEYPDARALTFARLFVGPDDAAKGALVDEWLTDQLSSMKDLLRQALTSGGLESQLSAACMLAEPHARGVDPLLGVAVGQAVCIVSETTFSETQSANYLFTLAAGARVCLIGFDSQGRYEEVIRAAKAATSWLEARGYMDAHPTLLMHCVEAHLQLDQLEDAGQVLAATENLSILDTQPAEQRRRDDLRRRFDAVARRSATELAPERTDPEGAFRANYTDLKEMVAGLGKMDQQMFGADSPFRNIVDTLTAEVQDESPSQAAWVDRTQNTRDALTELLSGGSGGMTALRNRNRAINAAKIFSDPTKGRDRAAIDASLAILIEAREWARTHDCGDDENFALWSSYMCYSRSERESQAIEVLQALRSNLEARRLQIADPMERAGVFLDYPYLFGSLCRLLCRAERTAELLDAMEGAKGRVLADALTAHRGEAVADAAFVRPIEELTSLLRAVRAHYLSYFVDDDETYAVLVTKDGSMHCHTIALGKQQLRELAQIVDPNRWTKPRAGYFGKPTTVPERLAPLIDWLGPFVDGGTLSPGDHLCYCPDEHLHLVPLHYVRFRGEPLVRICSVSRIHSAAAMTALLRGSATVPSQFLAAQVPAQQDLGDAAKVATLARVAAWLAEHFSGMTLARERATLDALSGLDLTNRIVHFATHGVFPKDEIEGRSGNPFTSSGLALASGGTLPSLVTITRGTSTDGLLTPEDVLTLNVDGSHVTLQACVTGLAKEGIGGDALGLDLAFLLAGARSLLTTHWDVSAHASADFSVRFYQKWLLEGSTRAEAWRGAILQLMDAPGSAGQPSEYYWAAFSLSGDWR